MPNRFIDKSSKLHYEGDNDKESENFYQDMTFQQKAKMLKIIIFFVFIFGFLSTQKELEFLVLPLFFVGWLFFGKNVEKSKRKTFIEDSFNVFFSDFLKISTSQKSREKSWQKSFEKSFESSSEKFVQKPASDFAHKNYAKDSSSLWKRNKQDPPNRSAHVIQRPKGT